MRKKFTIPRRAASIFSVFVIGFFLWYTTVFTEIDNPKANIATSEFASQSLKRIELVKIDGGRIPLGELFKKKKGTVVVFTRGAW
jgi:hypothetical protein